jgi:hypothetical protein
MAREYNSSGGLRGRSKPSARNAKRERGQSNPDGGFPGRAGEVTTLSAPTMEETAVQVVSTEVAGSSARSLGARAQKAEWSPALGTPAALSLSYFLT